MNLFGSEIGNRTIMYNYSNIVIKKPVRVQQFITAHGFTYIDFNYGQFE